MGFSSIVSFLMLFFALIITVSTLVAVQVNLIETRTAMNQQAQRQNEQFSTSIKIINISFDNETDPQTTTLFIENDGSRKLDTGQVDVFIDSVMIPRNGNNRTFEFVTNAVNPLHWDPGETVKLHVYLNVTNVTHTVTVTTDYGVKDTTYYLG